MQAATFNVVISRNTGGPLTVDATPTVVNIEREGQNGQYTFSGTAGQVVDVELTLNTLNDGNATTNNGTWVGLFAPSAVCCQLVTSGYLYSSASGLTLRAQLPLTGTYIILMDPAGLDKGTVTLQVRNR